MLLFGYTNNQIAAPAVASVQIYTSVGVGVESTQIESTLYPISESSVTVGVAMAAKLFLIIGMNNGI